MNFLPPFFLGFIATSFQIFLLREFNAHFYGNEVTYGLVLGAWLLWGGLGSIFASKIRLHLKSLFPVYSIIIILFPLCLVGLRFSRYLLHLLPGEVTGIAPAFVIAVLLSLFVSFPLGILFVLNIDHLKGNLSRVYLLESLGAAAAGMIVYFLLIPYLSNWQGAALAGAISSVLIFFSCLEKKYAFLWVSSLIFLAGFSFFDLPSQRTFWKPFHLLRGKDTPYGKLQAIKTEEQISLYSNNLQVYSYPNLAASEESVHFALLQRPDARRALLIGGGAGGTLSQLLKYPSLEVDYVELDPEVIRMSLEILPEEEKGILQNPRLHVFFKDGRIFVQRTAEKFDCILLNLPEPTTAQINRFYTKEFFLLVQQKLIAGGVFSFRIPSAENYISAELQQFLSIQYHTLRSVFPQVKVVPGDTNIFLASEAPLTIRFEDLRERIESLKLDNVHVTASSLFARLHPFRVNLLQEKLVSGPPKQNLDLTPVSYFFDSVLWSTQFGGFETKMLIFFSRLPSFWLLDFPLVLFVLALFFLWLKRKKTAFFLIPLAVMGLTTMALEVILIIWFQILYGYIYSRVALLLSTFMLGLFAGALVGSKAKKVEFRRLLLTQSGFLLLIFLFQAGLKIHPAQFFIFLFLFFLGFLGGDLFIISNRLFLRDKKNYGLGYGLDLGGSFLGAVVTSSLLIPLIGLPVLLKYLFLVNSFCFLFLLGYPKK